LLQRPAAPRKINGTALLPRGLAAAEAWWNVRRPIAEPVWLAQCAAATQARVSGGESRHFRNALLVTNGNPERGRGGRTGKSPDLRGRLFHPESADSRLGSASGRWKTDRFGIRNRAQSCSRATSPDPPG